MNTHNRRKVTHLKGWLRMPVVAFTCTNPNCQRQITFDQEAVGTVQQCPHCSQRVIVPDLVTSNAQTAIVPVSTAAPVPVPTIAPVYNQPPQATQYQQQERHIESQTARKLNMGSGCFAMLAVMFAFLVLAIGSSFIIGSFVPNFNPQFIFGVMSMIGGLAGLAAFVFFGYIATETTSNTRGSDRR